MVTEVSCIDKISDRIEKIESYLVYSITCCSTYRGWLRYSRERTVQSAYAATQIDLRVVYIGLRVAMTSKKA